MTISSPPNRGTVLIVDTDTDYCAALKNILFLEGYLCICAQSCADALVMAGQYKPQVIVLDFRLPDGWGPSLIAQLKAGHPDCVCIIATAQAGLEDVVTAFDQGAYHFLKKPFQAPELMGLLRRAFETCALRVAKREAEATLLSRNRELEAMVAEQKRLEAQLIQTQKLEALGTLASGVAHDFNNVLSGIIGYSELALLNLTNPEEAKSFLNKSLSACKRARLLIEQILTFSQRTEKDLSPVVIGPILKDALKFLRSTLPTTIQIIGDITPDCGAVMADATQIHRIMMNLCTNAAHAMHQQGGRLTVRSSTLSGKAWRQTIQRLHSIPPEPCLQISVTDTGIGIPPGIRERIFDPYFTTKEKGEGTGLGLAVVQGIVESYNGSIEVQSEVGVGTSFHIYLPLMTTAQRKATASQQPLVEKGTGHILMVDDEHDLVEIGAQMLSYLGYQVTTTTSSTRALELFRAEPQRYDLVITDMTMPDMTGDVLAQTLLVLRPDLPIILCTGYNELITSEKAKDLGMRGFMMKPVDLQTLAAAVRKAMSAPTARPFPSNLPPIKN